MSNTNKPASQELLNEIHESVANYFHEMLLSDRKINALTLNVIRQYLKDNNIVSNVTHSSNFTKLIDLPIFEEPNVIPMVNNATATNKK